MPTKPARHLTDLDYDLAQLGDPLTDDALDALSSVLDAREAITEMLEVLAGLQDRLERHTPAYTAREEYAIHLDQLADRIHIAVAGLLG